MACTGPGNVERPVRRWCAVAGLRVPGGQPWGWGVYTLSESCAGFDCGMFDLSLDAEDVAGAAAVSIVAHVETNRVAGIQHITET